jgi:rSAM/selenodomain-associated transferase 2
MISIVIPTLNAAAHLPRALAPLVPATAAGVVKQVIVSDGGSSDDTLAIAEAAGCDVVGSAPGRAKQLRAGAAAAKGKWLLFLHADTTLSPEWADAATAFMAAPSAQQLAAAFTLAFDDDSAAARRVVFWARLRALWLKLPYGDQGLLISRFLYEASGGYADMPLLEDVEFVRRLGAHRIRILQPLAVTSAEKYRRDGYSRRSWRNLWLVTRFLLGADPATLAKSYD